jgi:hypothetical protein
MLNVNEVNMDAVSGKAKPGVLSFRLKSSTWSVPRAQLSGHREKSSSGSVDTVCNLLRIFNSVSSFFPPARLSPQYTSLPSYSSQSWLHIVA